MPAYLRLKIGITFVATTIIVGVIMLDTAFFEPVVYKRWQPLSWDDFDGIPPLVTTYTATISSFIDVEYDSGRSTYKAYAAQHNVRSWVKRDSTEQKSLLQHEQYHFNITEIFARRLNQYIGENPNGDKMLFGLRLESLDIDRRDMQDQYDNETDHGTITDIQRRWEFRIDSMLSLKRGWLTDHFSGAQVYFPSTPDSSKRVSKQTAVCVYSLFKYGMYFGMMSLQSPPQTKSEFIYNVGKILKAEHGVESFSVDSASDVQLFINYDSAGYRNKTMWIKKDLYTYYLHTRYSLQLSDTIGYARMTESFINSFRVINTDSYWIEKLKSEPPQVTVRKKVKKDEMIPEMQYRHLVSHEPVVRGFYRGPLYSEDGTMVIAYDFAVHADSLHLRDVLRLGDDFYMSRPLGRGQLYWLPAASLPKGDSYVSIGYILEQDSAKEYVPLYQHVLHLKSQVKKRVD